MIKWKDIYYKCDGLKRPDGDEKTRLASKNRNIRHDEKRITSFHLLKLAYPLEEELHFSISCVISPDLYRYVESEGP